MASKTSSEPDLNQQIYQYDESIIHKVILLGDSGVGKTSFLVQFDTGKFQHGCFAATVGISFTEKIVLSDGVKVRLQIWDTAGQERFKALTHAYYRDADGKVTAGFRCTCSSSITSMKRRASCAALLLLYDVTARSSFDNIRAWLSEIDEYADENVAIILVGNKADMEPARVVKRSDGEQLAKEFSVIFMETSAKSGLNIEEAFQTAAQLLRCKRTGTFKKDSIRLKFPDQSSTTNRWSCCYGR